MSGTYTTLPAGGKCKAPQPAFFAETPRDWLWTRLSANDSCPLCVGDIALPGFFPSSDSVKSYRRLRRWLAAFLGACVLLGVGGQFLNARHEWFPFYSWFLFSLVPHEAVAYDLLLHESPRGHAVPPVPYRLAGDGLVRSPHSIDLSRAVQELGRALEAHDAAESARARAAIERRFTVSPVRYEVVKLTFANPLERLQQGALPRSRESLSTFVSGQKLRPAPANFSASEPAMATEAPTAVSR